MILFLSFEAHYTSIVNAVNAAHTVTEEHYCKNCNKGINSPAINTFLKIVEKIGSYLPCFIIPPKRPESDRLRLVE